MNTPYKSAQNCTHLPLMSYKNVQPTVNALRESFYLPKGVLHSGQLNGFSCVSRKHQRMQICRRHTAKLVSRQMRCASKSTIMLAALSVDATQHYKTRRHICADRRQSLRAVHAKGEGKLERGNRSLRGPIYIFRNYLGHCPRTSSDRES